MITSILLLIGTFIFIIAFIPLSEAHILIIGDGDGTYSDSYDNAKSAADMLKSKNYSVLELYRENATTKNILKGMYGADAVIYAGHGGIGEGQYDNMGGVANPPFSLVGSNDVIWGIGNKLREGYDGNLISAPFKKNIPVIIMGACFSTGWVGYYEVANPTETIYNFARMFTGAGANYFSTGYGPEIIEKFLDGALNFADANKKIYEPITKSTTYNGTIIWNNPGGASAFVGDWNGKFPTATQTTKYNDTAAENWYKTNIKHNGYFDAGFMIGSSGPYFVNKTLFLIDDSYVQFGVNTKYIWNFGDGKIVSSCTPQNPNHKYTKPGKYTIKYTITDTGTNRTSSTSATISVMNPKPDLVISKAYTSGNYLFFTVKNQGKTDSKACFTRASYGSYCKLIGTNGLKVGTSKTYKVLFKYKNGKVQVDYKNTVFELNEYNNGKKF